MKRPGSATGFGARKLARVRCEGHVPLPRFGHHTHTGLPDLWCCHDDHLWACGAHFSLANPRGFGEAPDVWRGGKRGCQLLQHHGVLQAQLPRGHQHKRVGLCHPGRGDRHMRSLGHGCDSPACCPSPWLGGRFALGRRVDTTPLPRANVCVAGCRHLRQDWDSEQDRLAAPRLRHGAAVGSRLQASREAREQVSLVRQGAP